MACSSRSTPTHTFVSGVLLDARVTSDIIIGELDFTMLHQICHCGRLDAFLHDQTLKENSSMASAYQLFSSAALNSRINPDTPLPFEFVINHRTKGDPLSSEIYSLILTYINIITQPSLCFRHFNDLPHPDHAANNILPPRAVPVKWIKHKTRTFSLSSIHAGNSSISYRGSDRFLAFGSIDSMWEVVLLGIIRTFIIVAPCQHLLLEDQLRSPYNDFPGFQCTIVYTQHQTGFVVIEPQDIVSHVAYYDRPSGTFGIKAPTSVLIESLYRNRD
jgi:hypothetical protein